MAVVTNYSVQRMAETKSAYRGSTVISKTVNVVGEHIQSYAGVVSGQTERRYRSSASNLLTLGVNPEARRVLYNSFSTDIDGTTFRLYHSYENTLSGGLSYSLSNLWVDYDNNYVVIATVHEYVPQRRADITGWWVDSEGCHTTRTDAFIMDWGQILAANYTPGDPDYIDPATHTIVGWAWGDVHPEDIYLTDNHASSGTSIGNGSSAYGFMADKRTKGLANTAYHSSGADASKQYYSSKDMGFQTSWEKTDAGDVNFFKGVGRTNSPGVVKVDADTYYIEYPGQITLFFLPNTDLEQEQVNVGNTVEMSGDDSKDPNPDNPSVPTSSLTIGSGGNTYVDSTKGAVDTDKLNEVKAHYADYLTTFDSVYMPSDTIDDFVDAGGGVVGESGMFPNAATLFIENISLSVSGSTLTVVQPEKFDNTTSLEIGEKVYGYVINSDSDVQPTFAGWVHSISKRLNKSRQEIVYTCYDLKKYLDQFVTNIYYSENSASIKDMATEVLIKSGITNFINNLPEEITASVDYTATSLSQVLSFLCTLAGDYYFWINRNNELVIDKLDGSATGYAIPTEGAAIGSNKVMAFNSLTDTSNSRSKIIVLGGSVYSIEDIEKNISTGILDTVDKISDMEGFTGCYTMQIAPNDIDSTIYRFYLAVSVATEDEILEKRTNGGSAHVTVSIGSMSSQFYHADTTMTALAAGASTIVYKSKNTMVFYLGTGRYTDNQWYPYFTFNMAGVGQYNVKYAYRDNSDPVMVSLDTDNVGGVHIHHDTNLVKIKSIEETRDDLPIMKTIANNLAEYYSPSYGGTLELNGLEIDLELGNRISITNTSLPSSESTNLKIYEIRFDIMQKITTVSLSTRPAGHGLTTDPAIIRANKAFYDKHNSIQQYSLIKKSTAF